MGRGRLGAPEQRARRSAGSSSESRTSTNGASSRSIARARMSSTSAYRRGATTSAMPWWPSKPGQRGQRPALDLDDRDAQARGVQDELLEGLPSLRHDQQSTCLAPRDECLLDRTPTGDQLVRRGIEQIERRRQRRRIRAPLGTGPDPGRRSTHRPRVGPNGRTGGRGRCRTRLEADHQLDVDRAAGRRGADPTGAAPNGAGADGRGANGRGPASGPGGHAPYGREAPGRARSGGGDRVPAVAVVRDPARPVPVRDGRSRPRAGRGAGRRAAGPRGDGRGPGSPAPTRSTSPPGRDSPPRTAAGRARSARPRTRPGRRPDAARTIWPGSRGPPDRCPGRGRSERYGPGHPGHPGSGGRRRRRAARTAADRPADRPGRAASRPDAIRLDRAAGSAPAVRVRTARTAGRPFGRFARAVGLRSLGTRHRWSPLLVASAAHRANPR